MLKLKKIVIGLAVVVALIIAGSLFLGSNIDPIVKAMIEKYGTSATQAQTTVESVKISVTSGEGSISGFLLANPRGFTSDSAIKIGNVSLKIAPKSVFGKGPITIREIVIQKPEVTYEVAASGENNLKAIQRNAMAFRGNFAEDEATAEEKKKGPQEEPRKIIIEKLVIEDGEATLNHELLKGKALAAIKIPSIQMTNIGKENGGVSPAAVTKLILNQLTTSSMDVAQSELVKQLGSQGLESIKGAVEQSEIGKKVGGAVKGLLGR